ncbi:hypothetical protein V2J09_006225 [Rumex salicifolius]
MPIRLIGNCYNHDYMTRWVNIDILRHTNKFYRLFIASSVQYTTPSSSTTSAFKQKIRIYNSMFSFTSFGARIDDKINRSRCPYAFRISGQNYHRIGSLLPETGNAPRYAQLYFCDPETEVQNRMGCMNLSSNDVDLEVVRQLIQMLDYNSAIAKAFRMARDWSQGNPTTDFKL